MSALTTFVFTDLVGSVDLKRQMPGSNADQRDEAYVRYVLTPHRERIEEQLATSGGRVVSTAGDGHFLAFTDTVKAAEWAIRVQQSHAARPILSDSFESAETGTPVGVVAVRIGMHVGAPQIDPADSNNYIGRAVDYAARLADQANSGQVLASRSVSSLLEDAGLDGIQLHSHGRLSLRGIGEVEIHEVLYDNRPATAPRKPKEENPPQRQWTVLPATMGLTEYVAGSSSGGTIPNSSSATIAPLSRLGNYELLERIGAGGMGNVYKARHVQFDRIRAVKLIKPELVTKGGDSVIRRFYQEVKATGSLEHPNLVVAIDSSTPEDDQHYLVMEYLEGVSVDEIVQSQGALPVPDACEIIRQAALGLEHLHRGNLVHRDVKPSNLMLTLVDRQDEFSTPSDSGARVGKQAVAKLLDLGLALLTENDQGRVTQVDHGGMGTGYYMSPEQWRTTSVDIRADIYSLGCTFFHLLTGKPPFFDSDLRPEKAHEREAVPPIYRTDSLPKEVIQLIEQMLAKNPEDRPQRPMDIALALAPHAEDHHLEALVAHHRAGTTVRGRSSRETRLIGQAGLDTKVRALPHSAHSGGSTLLPKSRWRATLVTLGLTTLSVIVLAWMLAGQRHQLLERHRSTLQKTATGVANSLTTEIKSRISTLRDLARDNQLRDWLTEIAKAPDDQSLWKPTKEWILQKKSEKDIDFQSSSWFLMNGDGIQIARAPGSQKTLGKSYAYRDYYHGEGADKPKGTTGTSPIDAAHQSAVYRSSSSGKLKVAFSVPIYDKEHDRILGVLGMSVDLGHFSSLEKADENEKGSGIEIMLVDSRMDYVDSKDAETESFGPAKQGLVLYHQKLVNAKKSYRIPESIIKELKPADAMFEDESRLIESYDAPFGNSKNSYWGAYAPVVVNNLEAEKQDTKWFVIAQEPKP